MSEHKQFGQESNCFRHAPPKVQRRNPGSVDTEGKATPDISEPRRPVGDPWIFGVLWDVQPLRTLLYLAAADLAGARLSLNSSAQLSNSPTDTLPGFPFLTCFRSSDLLLPLFILLSLFCPLLW